MNHSELDNAVNRLTSKLFELMQQKRDKGGWVSISNLAKLHEGSENYRDLIFAIKGLPDYKHLFAVSGNKIKLTEHGLETLSRPAKALSVKEEVINAIRDYASTIKKKYFDIESIKVIDEAGPKKVHALKIQTSDEIFSNGTPLDIYIEGKNYPYSGKIVGGGNDDSTLFVALGTAIYPDEVPTKLVIDSAYMTRQLVNRWSLLEHITDEINALTQPAYNGATISHHDSGEVAQMIAKIPDNWKRFLWGPPGSGKTYCIAKLIGKLLLRKPDERILVVAPSNLAVDGIAAELLRQFRNTDLRKFIEARQILRFGYPKSEFVLESPEILGSVESDELAYKANEISAKIAELRKKEAREEDIAIKAAELLLIQEKITASMSEHTKQVKVLFTTTAQCYLESSPIMESEWDTIIVDEVTMVPPAVCCFLSAITRKNILLAGDPRQLGPVFQHTNETTPLAEKWFGTDIFDFSDLNSAITNGDSDSRLIKITSQRRCSPDIWEEVKHLYPKISCLSKTSNDSIEGYEIREGLFFENSQSKNANSKCEKYHKSWQNKTSAELAVSITSRLFNNTGSRDIAIITPYRGQVKLLKELLAETELKKIVRIGTIHQFQGSEADFVIFDIVDGYGKNKPGILLRGDAGTRLVNVAITRARKQVFVIGDLEWIESKFDQKTNPLLFKIISKE